MSKTLDLLQKADFALAGLTSGGGMLTVEQSDKFIDEIIDQQVVLKTIRTVKMKGPTMELSAIGFGSRVTRPGVEATALIAGDRAVPTTRTIPLASKLYKAQTNMTYEVLEDNIAKGTLESTILRAFQRAVGRDMEELALRGDTANVGDAYLATVNGFPKRITTNTVNGAATGNTPVTYNNMLLSLADRYRGDLGALRLFVTPTMEQNYRLSVANRQTNLGDAFLTGNSPVDVMGVRMVKANFMPTGTAVLCDPFNLICGIQRDIRIESDRDIEAGLIKYVISFRLDFAIETEPAAVRGYGIA